jgi:peroxiredoxin
MAQFEPRRNEIEQAGAQLVFIAAERRTGVWKPVEFFEKHPTAFPFLLDESRSVTKAYGLYHRFGKDAINIAHPATFVVDRRGTVRFIYRGTSQTDRIPVDAVLAVVRKLSNSAQE